MGNRCPVCKGFVSWEDSAEHRCPKQTTPEDEKSKVLYPTFVQAVSKNSE